MTTGNSVQTAKGPMIGAALLSIWLAGDGCELAADDMNNAEHYPDHFVVGISDLDTGVNLVEKLTGVRPALGGTHPHIGTRNALISLGARTYLEIIAPTPDADPAKLDPVLKAQFMDPLTHMDTLTPFLWAVGSTDLQQTFRLLQNEGLQLSEPEAGSRKKPDGSLLKWRASFISKPAVPGLPFFIEWVEPEISPPRESPAGCLLHGFSVSGPESLMLENIVDRLGIETDVFAAAEPGLEITLTCPNGKIVL